MVRRLAFLALPLGAVTARPEPKAAAADPERTMAVTVDDLPAVPAADLGEMRPVTEGVLFVGRQGPSWLHRFRVAKGLPVRDDLDPDPPRWVLDLYREEQAR